MRRAASRHLASVQLVVSLAGHLSLWSATAWQHYTPTPLVVPTRRETLTRWPKTNHDFHRKKRARTSFFFPAERARAAEDDEDDEDYSSTSISLAAQDARLTEALRGVERQTTQETLTKAIVAVACAVALAIATFSPFADALRGQIEAEGLSVLAVDQGQYFQNYVNAINVLFSLLASNTFTFLYQQQESVYLALFQEVSVAKALLEQLAFISRGRETYALELLNHVERYVKDDLRRLDLAPATLLARPRQQDPLESVMWLTSVGAPGAIYETVKDLRAARGARLGALQRKLPTSHFVLLAVLGGFDLCVFPLLAAATGAAQKALQDETLIDVQNVLFAFMTAGVALVLRLLYALWIPTSSAYTVDGVLAVMVAGLEDEIKDRKIECQRAVIISAADTEAAANDDFYNHNNGATTPTTTTWDDAEDTTTSGGFANDDDDDSKLTPRPPPPFTVEEQEEEDPGLKIASFRAPSDTTTTTSASSSSSSSTSPSSETSLAGARRWRRLR